MSSILLVGKFKIQLQYTDIDTFVPICANCGKPLSIRELKQFTAAVETGYVYCSKECAVQDVKSVYEEEEMEE